MPKRLPKVTKFNPTELKMIELIIKEPGITITEIASKINKQRRYVGMFLKREDVQKEIEGIQMSAIEIFQEQQAKAVHGLAELMNSDNEYIRLQAYKEFVKPLQTLKIEAEVKTGIIYLDKQDENL